VQSAYSPSPERGNSVTDQRSRFVFSWIYAPRALNGGQSRLGKLTKGLNRRFQLTDNGALSVAKFNYGTKHIGINYFPAYSQVPTNLAKATIAYAPRQVQLSLRVGF